jgi:hypothetical protein
MSKADLDASIPDALSTFLTDTKVNADNLQNLGITGTNLQDGAVISSKIPTGAITQATCSDSLGITNAKFSDNTLENSRRAVPTLTSDGTDPGAGGIVEKTWIGSGSIGWASNTDYFTIGSLSVELTTTGRPVRLIVTDGAVDFNSTTDSVVREIALLRDGTKIATVSGETMGGNPSTTPSKLIREAIDNGVQGSGGTYTYTLAAQTENGGASGTAISINATTLRLLAYEI